MSKLRLMPTKELRNVESNLKQRLSMIWRCIKSKSIFVIDFQDEDHMVFTGVHMPENICDMLVSLADHMHRNLELQYRMQETVEEAYDLLNDDEDSPIEDDE